MPILNWIGKDKVINHHLDIPFHTLNEEYKFTSPQPSPKGEGVTLITAIPPLLGGG